MEALAAIPSGLGRYGKSVVAREEKEEPQIDTDSHRLKRRFFDTDCTDYH